MDAATLQNLVTKGMGVAGRKLGSRYAVYRPHGPAEPVRPQNRVIELSAAFAAEGAGLPQPPDYGQALWWGTFDASYTCVGDYLVGCAATYFVASQWPGLPVQCVLTNRVVTLARPSAASQGSYSGFFASPGEMVISGWPVSLLETGNHGVGLRPGETRLGNFELLAPVLPNFVQVADVVTDDLGATYVVGAAEQSALGWRLILRQLGA
jgi:hypothetical protein